MHISYLTPSVVKKFRDPTVNTLDFQYHSKWISYESLFDQ